MIRSGSGDSALEYCRSGKKPNSELFRSLEEMCRGEGEVEE